MFNSNSLAVSDTWERRVVIQALNWWGHAFQLSGCYLLPPQLYWTDNIDLLTVIIADNSADRAKSLATLTVMWADRLLLRHLPVQTKKRAMGRDLTGLQEERRQTYVTQMKANEKDSFAICTWFLSLQGASQLGRQMTPAWPLSQDLELV